MFEADSKLKVGGRLQRLHDFLRLAPRLSNKVSAGPSRTRRFLRGTEGAELLEFALALPLILVMVVGILDFATAYHLKQELANAAREGARLGSSQPTGDLVGNSSPPSIQTIKDDVTTYLLNAGVNTSFIGSTMAQCVDSNGNPITMCWDYTSSQNYGLRIERNVAVVSGGVSIVSTRVALQYPYDWTYGFNHIIQLLIPSATVYGTIDIMTDATMANLQ